MPIINKKEIIEVNFKQPMSNEEREKQKWDKIREEKQRSINIQTAFNQACEDYRENNKETLVLSAIKIRTKTYYDILKELHEEIK